MNDHLDADGLLSAALACHGQAVESRFRRELLLAAAATSDFTEYHTPAALRLALTIHQHIARFENQTDNWQQACYDSFIEEFESIIEESLRADQQRDASVAVVVMALNDCVSGKELSWPITDQCGRSSWQQVHGHQHSFFNAAEIPADDCPVLALSAVLPLDSYQLCSWRSDAGWHHIFDAPRYSWARTHRRIARPWPDCAEFAARLTAQDSCAWLASAGDHGL